MNTELKNLIGKTITNIFINTRFLKFITNEGEYVYEVTGDCCSSSYFFDFYGVKNLLGKVVKDVKEVELKTGDSLVYSHEMSDIKVYGYQIFNSDDDDYEPTTAVFSFRNSSNGYYGGSIQEVFPNKEDGYIDYQSTFEEEGTGELLELTKDIYEIN